MKHRLVLLLVSFAAFASLHAQSPAPVVIQAIAPGQLDAQRTAAAPVAAADSSSALVKALQEMKAANDELLKKQAAALQQLDEIEKSVDQIRIYSKRG